MKYPKYPVVTKEEPNTYEFYSEGSAGRIEKVVRYEHMEHNVFNLAFSDWHKDSNEIDDVNRSNNSDRDLYQMGIGSNLLEISALFQVRGLIQGAWEHFQKGKNYQSFLVQENKLLSLSCK